MKRSPSFGTKLAVVAGLAAASSALTSLSISAVRRASATPPPAPTRTQPRSSVSVRVKPPGEPFAEDPPGPARGPGIVAGYAMNFIHVQMRGNVAVIDAKALLEDSRVENRYVWSVRVLNTTGMTGDVLFQKVYDDQIFALPETRQRSATFQDEVALPLPPGEYRLELCAYMVTPRDGLAAVRRPRDTEQPYRGAFGTHLIKIGD